MRDCIVVVYTTVDSTGHRSCTYFCKISRTSQ